MRADGMKILLVEDNPGDARLMREMLIEARQTPSELTHVARLSEAITQLTHDHFDVVLLDLSLPDAHGLETVERVCNTVPHVPVVVLTGLNDETLAVHALHIGAQDYLVKGQIESTWLVRSLRYAIERQRMRMALRSLALIDELTGLYNRRGFVTFAEEHFKLIRRTKRKSSFVFVDLDGLKKINDTFGHTEGDLALLKSADILRQTFRDSDIIARVGGDEFTVLAIDASGDDAKTIRPRIQENLRQYNTEANRGYELSLSLGVAPLDPDSLLSIEELMAKADAALYAQKRSKSTLA